MTLTPARKTLTTTAQKVADNPGGVLGGDEGSVRVELVFQSATGTVLIGGATGSTAGFLRLDIAIFAAWSTVLEPGEELWMAASTGTIGVDLIVGGR